MRAPFSALRARQTPLLLWILLLSLGNAACDGTLELDGPIYVRCDGPSPSDTTAIQVLLDEPAWVAGGRILVRVDSLASREGPIFDAPSGFLVQAFAEVGPGYGCASILNVGAVIEGPGRSLARAWVHVKSDLPVQVTVHGPDGRVVSSVVAGPGTRLDPLVWAAGS